MSDYKFKFSVVIPIYKVEKYLEETIQSVIAQDIGFKENIQLILVNDGSPDDSEAICLRYRDLYPENVVYYHQTNSGVSCARNNGVQFVEGKYVNFLDADDKWSEESFTAVWNFFEKVQDKVDLVACPQKFFEASEDSHPLSFKFIEGERVIDILDKYDYIQLHITASFVKASILEQYKFDEELRFSEDAKFVTEIILDKLCYGATNKAQHYYRKRKNNSSAVQNKAKHKSWFLDTPLKYTGYLMEKSKEKYGIVLPYIQYTFMYDMQYRVREKNMNFLSSLEINNYHKVLHDLLQNVDDDLIVRPDKILAEHRVSIFSMKYGKDIRNDVQQINSWLSYNNLKVYDLNSKALFVLQWADVSEGFLNVKGYIWTPYFEQCQFHFVSEGNEIPIQTVPENFKQSICFNETITVPYSFNMNIPAKKTEVMLTFANGYKQPVYIAVDSESRISPAAKELIEVEKAPKTNREFKPVVDTANASLDEFVYRSGKLLYHNVPVFNLKKDGNFEITEIVVKKDTVTFEGHIHMMNFQNHLEYQAIDGKGIQETFELLENDQFAVSVAVRDQARSIRFLYCFNHLFKGRLCVPGFEGKTHFVIGDRRFAIEKNIIKIYPMTRKEKIFHKLGIGKE